MGLSLSRGATASPPGLSGDRTEEGDDETDAGRGEEASPGTDPVDRDSRERRTQGPAEGEG